MDVNEILFSRCTELTENFLRKKKLSNGNNKCDAFEANLRAKYLHYAIGSLVFCVYIANDSLCDTGNGYVDLPDSLGRLSAVYTSSCLLFPPFFHLFVQSIIYAVRFSSKYWFLFPWKPIGIRWDHDENKATVLTNTSLIKTEFEYVTYLIFKIRNAAFLNGWRNRLSFICAKYLERTRNR